MAMKEFLKISAMILVLTVALTLTLGLISYSSTVAFADDNDLYAYVAPSNLTGSEHAEKSAVPVYPMSGGKVAMFYLIESYYYPVVEANFTKEIMMLDVDGLNAYIEVKDLPTAPARNSAVSSDNALPAAINTNGGMQIGGVTVNSAEGWTVKPIGLTDDGFYVQAMKDSQIVFGAAPKTAFVQNAISYHPIAQAERDSLIAEVPADESEESVSSSSKSSVALRVVLIIGIAIPAVIIAILLFKPRRNDRSYDDKREMRRREQIDYDRDREYHERDDVRRRDYDDDYYRGYSDGRDDRDRYNDRDYRDRDRDRDYRDRDRDYRDRDYRGYDDRNDRR